jgi:hypothetical protein
MSFGWNSPRRTDVFILKSVNFSCQSLVVLIDAQVGMGPISRGGDLEMAPGAERGKRFVGLIVCALSSCSGCFSSSTADFSSAERTQVRTALDGLYHDVEYLAAWRTICLPQNHHPSYRSVPQIGEGQPAKVGQVVRHSLQPQEEPTSSPPDEVGNTFNDDARAPGKVDSLNRGLLGEVGNSCRATFRCSRP